MRERLSGNSIASEKWVAEKSEAKKKVRPPPHSSSSSSSSSLPTLFSITATVQKSGGAAPLKPRAMSATCYYTQQKQHKTLIPHRISPGFFYPVWENGG